MSRDSSREARRRGTMGLPDPMRRVAVFLLVLLTCAGVRAHDLFLRPGVFVVDPGQTLVVAVLNGTFSRSENAVARDRLSDLSVVTPEARQRIDLQNWTEQDPQSTLSVRLDRPGTHVLGAAVRPRLLALAGKEFNAYLAEEGLDRVLARRKQQGRLEEPSRERYSKYVKALVQVGASINGRFDAPLGYAAELVPLSNPYAARVGDSLTIRCLVDGAPAHGLVVFAGGRKGTSGDVRLPQQRLVSDAEGLVRVRLTAAGAWYVKFVHMADTPDDPESNYESKWATVTFAVR